MTNPEHFRPLGNRVLVKRLPLPDASENGIYILGRDYPTIGRVLRVGTGPRIKHLTLRRQIDLLIGSLVSWRISPNFDQYDLGNDYLLLPYSELNFVIEKTGRLFLRIEDFVIEKTR